MRCRAHVSERTVSLGEYRPLSDALGPEEAPLDRKGSAETGHNSSPAKIFQQISLKCIQFQNRSYPEKDTRYLSA